MTALFPYARLIRLSDGAVVATSTNVLKGLIQRVLDAPGSRSITVPLGDAGDGTDTASGFANALLAAVGGPGLTGVPVPTLIEVSLDGGTTVDARWLVEKVVPDLSTGQLALTCSGDAAGSLYGAIGPDRFPAREIALCDVLGGATNAINPKNADYYGITVLGVPVPGTIPGLSGILNAQPGDQPGATPGSPLWATSARWRFAATGVISDSLAMSALALLPVTIDSWEDSTLRLLTSLFKIMGGTFFPTDTADQGSRGHAVWCDADTGLAGDLAAVVCDGTPFTFTYATSAGHYGLSNAGGRAGSGGSGTCTLASVGRLVRISSVTGGSGYTAASTFAVSGGGGAGAQVQPVLSGGVITGFLIPNKGAGYTSTPTLAQTGGPGTGGGGACVLGYAVASVTASGGSNYWSGAQVTVVPAGGDTTGNGALVALDIAGGVPGASGYGVTAGRLLAGGQDYSLTPSLTIAGRAGVPNALVVGNVGGSPRGVAFTFDATATTPLAPSAEASTARVLADQTSLVEDLTALYGEIRLTGGTNDAGLAPSETITSLITLNNQPIELGPPYISWQNVLPFIGTTQQDLTGNLYFDAGDGQLRAAPSWGNALPIYDLVVDGPNGTIYASTSQGVFSHPLVDGASAFLTVSVEPWTRVGGLTFRCKRMVGVPGTSGAFWLYVLVSGVTADTDGIYQYVAGTGTPSAQTGAGYDHWVRVVPKADLLDMVATDGESCFYLDKADQQENLWLWDAGAATSSKYPLYSAGYGQGVRLDRVTTATLGFAQDSVWVACSGGSQPAVYLLAAAGTFVGQTLQVADHDGSLKAAVGLATGLAVEPQVNRAVSLGYGINGVTIGVMLCTNAGVYFMGTVHGVLPSTGGTTWLAQANGLNGLAGLSILDLVAGQTTSLPSPYDPASYVTASRLYAISGSALFYSYSDARYWRDLLREPLVLGPFFYALAGEAMGVTLPDWSVQTIGPMASSPISGPLGSHLQVADCLPTGWYWRRRFNACYEPYYALVPSTVASPQVYTEQITEVAVSPSTTIAQAADDLATFFIMLAGEHATKQPALEMHATFTQQESGLRFLWPTHAVQASQTGSIKMLSSDGMTAIDTTYIDLEAAALYVLSHTIDWDGPLFTTTTQMGASVRGPAPTGADLAAALVRDLRVIHVKGLRSKK